MLAALTWKKHSPLLLLSLLLRLSLCFLSSSTNSFTFSVYRSNFSIPHPTALLTNSLMQPPTATDATQYSSSSNNRRWAFSNFDRRTVPSLILVRVQQFLPKGDVAQRQTEENRLKP